MMSRFRILLVANGPSEVAAIEKSLDKLKGIEVITTSSVMEALSRLSSMQFHLILCQLELPSMSGIELLEELKAKHDYRNIPLVFLTEEYSNKHFQQMGYEIGSFDYLKRPLKEDRLLNKVAVYQKLFEKCNELNEAKRMISEIRNDSKNKKSA
jgi:CheY-like chemotaxis protein